MITKRSSQKSVVKKHIHIKGVAILGTLLLAILSLCGCENSEVTITKETGTTFANIAMGMGRFAYKDGLLYFADPTTIYEYDIENGKTVFLPVNMPGDPTDLMIAEDHIIYCGSSGNHASGAIAIAKDGKSTKTLFKGDGGCYRLYADEKDAYYMSFCGGNLYHRDLATEEEMLILENTFSYFVTNDKLYAIQIVDEKYILKACTRNDFSFDTIELSFDPIELLVVGDEIYLSQKGDFQLVRYYDGEETFLPIYSMKYQVHNNRLIYSDEKTFRNSTWTIKSYDLETGAEMTLCESAMEFGVFDKGFIVFWCRGEAGSWWKLYDEQTGSLRQIYPAT